MNKSTLPIEHGMILDMEKRYTASPVRLYRRGDSSAHKLKITLSCGGNPFILPDDAQVTVYVRRADGTALWASCEKEGDDCVTHTFTASELSVSGKAECELYIVTASNAVTSPKFTLFVEEILRNETAIAASDDFSVLSELVAKTEKTAEDLLKKSVLKTETAPTSQTAGEVGDVLVNMEDGTFYRCASAENGSYDWNSVGKTVYLTIHKPLLPGQSNTYVVNELESLCHEGAPVILYLKYYNSAGNMKYSLIPASYSVSSPFLNVWATTNSASNMEAIRIIYSTMSKIASVEVRKLFAGPNNVEEEDFQSSPPTVEAVNKMLETKQECEIQDSGAYFTEKTVEGALQQVGAALTNAQSSLDAVLAMIGGGV